jgi:hypothetical protein
MGKLLSKSYANIMPTLDVDKYFNFKVLQKQREEANPIIRISSK